MHELFRLDRWLAVQNESSIREGVHHLAEYLVHDDRREAAVQWRLELERHVELDDARARLLGGLSGGRDCARVYALHGRLLIDGYWMKLPLIDEELEEASVTRDRLDYVRPYDAHVAYVGLPYGRIANLKASFECRRQNKAARRFGNEWLGRNNFRLLFF